MMDHTTLMDAMNCVDPALVEAAAAGKRRSAPWRRTGLIAACLCLALIGTAVAGEIIAGGGGLLEFFRGQTFPEVDVQEPVDGYSVTNIGVTPLPVEDFSQQVQDLAKNAQEDMVEMPFSSWAAAQRYLGVELMRNDVLDGAGMRKFGWGAEENMVHCLVQVGAWENLLRWAHVTAAYDLTDAEGDRVVITVVAQAYTEHTLVDPNSIGITTVYDQGTAELLRQEYTAANGVPVTVVEVRRNSEEGNSAAEYDAYFSMNGIRYQVMCRGQDNSEAALAVLKQVLDAFR